MSLTSQPLKLVIMGFGILIIALVLSKLITFTPNSMYGGSKSNFIIGTSLLTTVLIGVFVVLVLFVLLKKGNGSNSRGKQQ
jgi:hypothetical protein